MPKGQENVTRSYTEEDTDAKRSEKKLIKTLRISVKPLCISVSLLGRRWLVQVMIYAVVVLFLTL